LWNWVLRAKVAAGEKTAIDEYGATNPAEFFAVATESFFERPRDLQQRHPALYEELKRFYLQDPVGWAPAAEAGNGTNRKPTPPILPPAPKRQTDSQEQSITRFFFLISACHGFCAKLWMDLCGIW
jgi:hypothetical protein